MFDRYGTGTTIWSSLCGGLLTGKYIDFEKEEIVLPEGSRFSTEQGLQGKHGVWMKSNFPRDNPDKCQQSLSIFCQLHALAEEIGCTMAQMSLAWVLAYDKVSTVILGASRPEQLEENVKAFDVLATLNQKPE